MGLQVITMIWWLAKLDDNVKDHEQWIAEHRIIAETVSRLEERVNCLYEVRRG